MLKKQKGKDFYEYDSNLYKNASDWDLEAALTHQ
jgi:hypothetical protein